MIRKTTLVQDDQKEYRVKIDFDSIDMYSYQRVINLPGRKYHPDNECWSIPIYEESINSLTKWGFEIDPHIRTHVENILKKRESLTEMPIPGLKGELFKFQKQGVAFLEEKKGRALISDEQGLGKTIQTIAWLQNHPEKIPVVIVSPSSVKLNWQKEMLDWMTNPKIQVLQGTSPYKITKDIIIINYDILTFWTKTLIELKPQVIIFDESQKIKSSTTKRTKAAKKVVKNIPCVIGLSGTPVMNKPIEIFNILKMIDENLFPHFSAFVNQFCNPRYNGYGWDYSGASHTQELHQRLTSTVMLRRLKKDVLPDLPDKIISYVPVELDNSKEYIFAENNFIEWIRRTKGDEHAEKISKVEQLAKIEGLKQLAVKGKLKQSIEWIRDFLESGEKLVIFCTHKFVVETLMTEFNDIAVKIDGSCSSNQKQKAKEAFQTQDEVKLLIGNAAAEEGLTLTAASNLLHLELPWSPKNIDQRSDRVHRITQTKKVTIYFLLAAGTIEEKIAKLLDRKRVVVDAVIDGKKTEQENLLHELMRMYSK